MDDAVAAFENTILYYADAFHTYGPGSLPSLMPLTSPSYGSPDNSTPELSDNKSTPSSISSDQSSSPKRPSFTTRLSNAISSILSNSSPRVVEVGDSPSPQKVNSMEVIKDATNAWQIEAASVDRSVRILPGVKKLMSSIPIGRYAVATSGAKTYGSSELDS